MGGLAKYNKDKDTKTSYTINTTYLSPHKTSNLIDPIILASLLHAQNE